MDAMRADMGGAATVCASVVTAAALKLPINIIGGFCDTVKLELGFIDNFCKNIFNYRIFLSSPMPSYQAWLHCVRTCPVGRQLSQGMWSRLKMEKQSRWGNRCWHVRLCKISEKQTSLCAG